MKILKILSKLENFNKENEEYKAYSKMIWKNIQDAVNNKIDFHAEWSTMQDLISSKIHKHMKLPSFYSKPVVNELYSTYEQLVSRTRIDELPITMKSRFGQNNEIISIYEKMIVSEDERMDGGKVRKKIIDGALVKQIAWIKFYVDDSENFEAYGKNWKNQIRQQFVDGTLVHYDPNTTEMDLSDCGYLAVQQETSWDYLVTKYGYPLLEKIGIKPGNDDGINDNPEQIDNYNSERSAHRKKLFKYYFRLPSKGNRNFDYYVLDICESKILTPPQKCRPNTYPLRPYTRIRINNSVLMGTNELYLTRDDYITNAKIASATSTNVIFESGSQKILNAGFISPKGAKNIILNPFALIPVQGTNNLDGVVRSLPKTNLPNGAFIVPQNISAKSEKTTGVGGIYEGDTGSLQSGQAVSAAINQAGTRNNKKEETLREFLHECTKVLIMFMEEYYKVPMVYPIPKEKAGAVNNLAQQAQQGEQMESDSKGTSSIKETLKNHKIKFKETKDMIYVIAEASDIKEIAYRIDISPEKIARQNDQVMESALMNIYAMDAQNPGGTPVLSKEKFIEMLPSLRPVAQEILKDWRIRKSSSENNKVKFIAGFVTSQMQAMQMRGMPPEAIPIQQLQAQALQMWQSMPANYKEAGAEDEIEFAENIGMNSSTKGVTNSIKKGGA